MLSEGTQISSLPLSRVLRKVQLYGLILLQGQDSILVKGKLGFDLLTEISCGEIISLLLLLGSLLLLPLGEGFVHVAAELGEGVEFGGILLQLREE